MWLAPHVHACVQMPPSDKDTSCVGLGACPAPSQDHDAPTHAMVSATEPKAPLGPDTSWPPAYLPHCMGISEGLVVLGVSPDANDPLPR